MGTAALPPVPAASQTRGAPQPHQAAAFSSRNHAASRSTCTCKRQAEKPGEQHREESSSLVATETQHLEFLLCFVLQLNVFRSLLQLCFTHIKAGWIPLAQLVRGWGSFQLCPVGCTQMQDPQVSHLKAHLSLSTCPLPSLSQTFMPVRLIDNTRFSTLFTTSLYIGGGGVIYI